MTNDKYVNYISIHLNKLEGMLLDMTLTDNRICHTLRFYGTYVDKESMDNKIVAALTLNLQEMNDILLPVCSL